MFSRTRVVSLASCLILPAAASAQPTNSIVKGPLTIGLEHLTNTVGPPIDFTHAGDGTNRVFIAGQSTGDVRLFKDNALVTTPFLDVNGTGVTGAALSLIGTGERGLLGMAFHPNFAAAGQPGFGKFYTYTSETKGANITGVDFIHDEQDDANLGDHDSVIREWTVNPSNPDQVLINTSSRPSSGRVVMRIRQPQGNHNGGSMKFGPDGMLHVALGDGGGANDESGNTSTDGHTNASATVRGNAQDVQEYALKRNLNVFGKVLRIDPRDPATTSSAIGAASLNGQYRIPGNNPRVGLSGADEVFAYGLRNPFRMSFDRLTGSLYTGDVGQGAREEIDIITPGGNYGWVYREGTRSNFTAPAGFTSIDPVGEYTHSDGQAVIGGFVYRGNDIPELYGKYIFGELDWDNPATTTVTERGRILYMDAAGGTINEFNYLLNTPGVLYAFGEDRDGELYAMFADGNVRKILGRQWYVNGGGSWGTSGNWLVSLPNGSGAAANFLGRLSSTSSAPAVVNLDGSRTVGTMLFNNSVSNPGDSSAISYRIAQGSGGTLTLDNGASSASVKVINGNHQITAPVSVATSAQINIAASGSLDISGAVNVAGSRTLTKNGAGAASLSGGVTLASTSTLAVTQGILSVRNVSGGAVTVNNARLNVLASGGPTGTSKVNSLSIVSGGRLNLADNKFIVTGGSVGTSNGSTYSGLSGLIQTGRAGGAWNGVGIMSSDSRAGAGLAAIGIATAGQIGRAGTTFSGVSVAAGDVIMMLTYGGDANLDGFVSADDYTAIDFAIATPGSAGWVNGDFNYDGFISADDYTIIDFNIAAQGPAFSTGGTAGLAAVPEPSGAAAAAAAATLSMLGRRRRHP